MLPEQNETPPPVSKITGLKARFILLVAILAGIVVGLDQLTKILVEMNLAIGETGWDWGFVSIRHLHNTGLAWGLFGGAGGLFVWLIPVVVVLLGVFYLYFLKNSPPSILVSIAFALIIGGAVGNAVDRIRQGGVTDFINPSFWATFNLADAAISVGFVLMIVAFFVLGRRAEPPPPQPNRRTTMKYSLTWQSDLDALKRLDVAIATEFPTFSRSEINRFIKLGLVNINGTPIAKPAFLPKIGDLIEFDHSAYLANLAEQPPPKMPPILYEDEHIAVVNKPAGSVVHAGHGHQGDTLAETFKSHWGKIQNVGEDGKNGIVHRLDKNTSGVLLVALTQKAHTQLQADLKKRAVERTYIALAMGLVEPASGIIDAPLARDKKNPLKRTISEDGKEARTNYKTITHFKSTTLLELKLESGRTHQIRAHLASIGYPVCGDTLYGGQMLFGLTRQFLHAKRIKLLHPVSHAPIECEAELPADLNAVLEQLR